MIEIIDSLLHEWGAWSKNGGMVRSRDSIAHAMTQMAPCDDARIHPDDGVRVRLSARKAELQKVYAGQENCKSLVTSHLASEKEVHRLYRTVAPQETRSRKIKLEDNSELEKIDSVIAQLNKRFKHTLLIVYVYFPNVGRKMQASKLGIHEASLYRRIETAHKQIYYALDE